MHFQTDKDYRVVESNNGSLKWVRVSEFANFGRFAEKGTELPFINISRLLSSR